MTKPREWVVQTPCSLQEALNSMGLSSEALVDGRVFVNEKRCTDPDTSLEKGTLVQTYPASKVDLKGVHVIERRDDMLAVFKPAGLSTIPDQRGFDSSLSHEVARLVGIPDVNRVHTTSRLDREVSGVVVFALGPQAQKELREAREKGYYRRHYVALTQGTPTPPAGIIDVAIGRGKRPTERKVGGKNAVKATTVYATVSTCGGVGMVAVEPGTGRTHQIRVHLAHQGAPLIGDGKYGKTRRLTLNSGAVVPLQRIALHAAWVEVRLLKREPWRVHAPIPQELETLWQRLGGQQDCWDRALLGLDTMIS